jgi:hypothetical protein
MITRKPAIPVRFGISILIPLVVIMLFQACALSTKDSLVFSGPMSTGRVESKDSGSSGIKLPRTVAVLPFINKTDKSEAFDVVRRTIFNHFSSKNYLAIHIQEIDRRLKAGGIDNPEQLESTEPARIARILGADGMLYGEITHYDRTFLGIYSQIAVGVKLRFVDASGTEIWKGEKIARSHAGGISTNAVGLILSAISAGIHLREVNLFRASDDLGRDLIAEIPEEKGLHPVRLPLIKELVHDGVGRVMRYGDTLSIAMEGDPGNIATARIESFDLIDLAETEPGIYSGKINIGKDINISEKPLTGILQNKLGYKREWISPIGLIDVDNIPPKAINNPSVESHDGILSISWSAPEESDIDCFRITASDSSHGTYNQIATVKDLRFEDKGLDNFVMKYYRISAVDRAKNESLYAEASGRPFPDRRFAEGEIFKGAIPENISGIGILSQEGGPYRLSKKSNLLNSGILLVEPGVEILVGQDAYLEIGGELQVYGTLKNMVRVSGIDGRPFNYFIKIISDKPVSIRGLEIKGAGIPVTISAGSPGIIDCRLIDNRFSALEISGASRPLIRNTEIDRSSSGGVVISDHAQPRFEKNTFRNNRPFHILSSSPYRLFAKDNLWEPAASDKTVIGNVDYR